jgi:hypothetical protein
VPGDHDEIEHDWEEEKREELTSKDFREMDARFPWVMEWGLEGSWMTE